MDGKKPERLGGDEENSLVLLLVADKGTLAEFRAALLLTRSE